MGNVEVTREFLEEMKAELETLKTETRLQVAARLKEAIALGDLSENSEYEDAKNQQAFTEGRIAELEAKIRKAKIIEKPEGDEVALGSVVKLKDLETQDTLTYTIVSSAEADPFDDKISNESPVGSALIGKKSGDVVTVEAPEQQLKYEIVEIVNKTAKKAPAKRTRAAKSK